MKEIFDLIIQGKIIISIPKTGKKSKNAIKKERFNACLIPIIQKPKKSPINVIINKILYVFIMIKKVSVKEDISVV